MQQSRAVAARQPRSSASTTTSTLFTTPTSSGCCSTTCCGSSSFPRSPSSSVCCVATFADRLGQAPREDVQVDHLPADGASAASRPPSIWRFIYFYAPPGNPQIYLLNDDLDGHHRARSRAVAHDRHRPRSTASCIMFIVIWLQVGFAMVLLSAAIKGVPEETIEAARIDGASERQAVLPRHRSADPRHDRRGLRHGAHHRHEDLRHRLRDDRRPVQHERAGASSSTTSCSASRTRARRRPSSSS